MTFDDLYRAILKALPEATMEEDNEGQLIVYTDRMIDPQDGEKLIPFTDNPSEKEKIAQTRRQRPAHGLDLFAGTAFQVNSANREHKNGWAVTFYSPRPADELRQTFKLHPEIPVEYAEGESRSMGLWRTSSASLLSRRVLTSSLPLHVPLMDFAPDDE